MGVQTRQRMAGQGSRTGPTALTAVVALLLIVPTASLAKDWPQFRGPDYDGVSREDGWRSDWSNMPPRLLWKQDLGVGYASVAVQGGRVYTGGWDDGMDIIYCLDAATGEVIWRHRYRSGKWDKNGTAGGPAGTPAVADGRVFTLGREGQLNGLDAESGEVIWRKNLKEQYGTKIPQWGLSGSPTVVGDRVLVEVGRVLAFDAATGRELAKTRDYGSAYSTPVPFEHGGKQYIAAFPEFGLVVLEADTLREVAKHRWKTAYGVNAATPVVVGDRIFISSGYNVGCALLRFTGRDLRVLWQNRNMRNQMDTCVILGEYIYGFNESALTCLSLATGEEVWSKRGLGKGSVAAAGGHLIVQAERGELIIAEATPTGYKETGRAHAWRGGRGWIVPVLANGRLYARGGRSALVCFDVSP